MSLIRWRPGPSLRQPACRAACPAGLPAASHCRMLAAAAWRRADCPLSREGVTARMADQHECYMRLALSEAAAAMGTGDIPVGAVVVLAGEVIASGHNEKELRRDATAHAEMLAMQRACRVLGDWRLTEATLYCTLEPCAMCAGAMVQVRLGRLVYAADDPKAGAAGSILDVVRLPALNHHVEVIRGVMAAEADDLLKRFFAGLRADHRL